MQVENLDNYRNVFRVPLATTFIPTTKLALEGVWDSSRFHTKAKEELWKPLTPFSNRSHSLFSPTTSFSLHNLFM